jgi:hypothetical protein
MYEAAASCKDIARAPVTNWEPHCVTLAGYCDAVKDTVTPWGTGWNFSSELRIVSVTCNVTALRYAVTVQVCTHLKEGLCALECLYRCMQRGVEFLSELCPSSRWVLGVWNAVRFMHFQLHYSEIQLGRNMYHIVLYYDQQIAQLFHKLSHSYMFRHYRVILRELVISTLPSYTSISNDIFINCSWVVTRWQYTFTHKQYVEQHK